MWVCVTLFSKGERFRWPPGDGQLVASAATRVQRRLRETLAERHPSSSWTTEYRVGSTAVDVAGECDETLVLVELEWRRADPADNTAKLFRHLASETLDAEVVHVWQLFTTYYDLASGGVSSKRKNAEFVGERVADAFEHVDYTPLTLPVDPPKRGGELPQSWEATVDETASSLVWWNE